MTKIENVSSVHDYNAWVGQADEHPLVSVIDYDETTLICVAPGQIGGKEDNGERVELTGWALLFHPDLLRGTFLERKLQG